MLLLTSFAFVPSISFQSNLDYTFAQLQYPPGSPTIVLGLSVSVHTHLGSLSGLVYIRWTCPANIVQLGYGICPRLGLIKFKPSTPAPLGSLGILSSGICLPSVTLCFENKCVMKFGYSWTKTLQSHDCTCLNVLACYFHSSLLRLWGIICWSTCLVLDQQNLHRTLVRNVM